MEEKHVTVIIVRMEWKRTYGDEHGNEMRSRENVNLNIKGKCVREHEEKRKEKYKSTSML